MAQTPLVNFVISGVQKGGTTALHAYLADEPDIILAREKEAHFFDDDTRDWSRPDYADYHAMFDMPVNVARRDGPCGEATPIYLYWPECLERIHAYNPQMRLIILLRDPVQRAWSHWRMERARGVETHDFGWCVRQGRQRLLTREPWGFDREISYVERGFYGEQLERLFKIFPRDQVLLLRSDELDHQPGPTLARVRAFIGAPPAPAPKPRRVHEGAADGLSLLADDAAFLRSLYRRDNERLIALTGFGFDA